MPDAFAMEQADHGLELAREIAVQQLRAREPLLRLEIVARGR